MTVRLFAALVVLAGASACSTPEPDPQTTALVGEADVARVQAETFQATQPIDADIAEIEGEAALLDSLRQPAYTVVLERLRRDRRRLQLRVDSLAPLPRAQFDTTVTAIGLQTDRLRTLVARARFDAAQDPETLAQATLVALGPFDRRLANAVPLATADTTGRLRLALDSLAADRARLGARITAFADTTAPAFARLRTATVRDAQSLRRRLDAAVPDTTEARTAPGR